MLWMSILIASPCTCPPVRKDSSLPLPEQRLSLWLVRNLERHLCPCMWFRRLTQAPLQLFQEFERFVVTATLEVMCQTRIDWLRKLCLQLFDFFRHGTQARHVFLFVAAALFVVNNGEAFSQRVR